MPLYSKYIRSNLKNRKQSIQATRVIALIFLAIIAAGAILLMLPTASRDGNSCPFLDALFTAASATCVTGLTPFDTYSQWSAFGQGVLLCLIEVGGLGFMSAAAMVIFFFRRRVGLKERLIMAQALSLNEMDGVVQLQKLVVFGSLGIQAAGAMILTVYFWPTYGFSHALRWGVFHAVSAFCNAGFDIFGELAPGSSLMLFREDPIVLLTLSVLIILGGLGFLVWEEIVQYRSFHRLSVYAKLVLISTAALLMAGWILTCIMEWNNPATLGELQVSSRILGGFFQSVTLRTAGFDAIGQGSLTDGSKAAAMVFMLIGGSSGSTAGGLKTVTFLVLILFMVSRARGRSSVTVFRRTIPQEQAMNAMTIAIIMIVMSMAGGIVIAATSPVGFTDALYESVSALGTVGLTAGATTLLSTPSRLLIILYMYFGRVGVLTISMGFLAGNRAEERFRYADTSLLIG